MRYARHTRLAPASKEFGNGKTNSRMAFQNLWEREDAPELKPNRGNGCYGVQGVSIFSRLGHFNIEKLFLTKCSGGTSCAYACGAGFTSAVASAVDEFEPYG